MTAPYRLLVITSVHEEEDASPAARIRRYSEQLKGAGVALTILSDPSRFTVERLIREEEFDAVLPIPLYGHDEGECRLAGAYSIPQVLEQNGANTVGCSYYVQLLTADKTVSLSRSGCERRDGY